MATTIAEKLTAISAAKEAIKIAIESKGVEVANAPLAQYAEKINAIEVGGGGGGESTPKYTGHADVEGLKAIGWTDEDIAYYQQYGVNWNEEDDELHKVPEENIAIYKEINADNYKNYVNEVVYMPKIDFSKKTTMAAGFYSFLNLVAIPSLDLSGATSISQLCMRRRNLTCVGKLITPNATTASSVFSECSALRKCDVLDLPKAEDINGIYKDCASIEQVEITGLSNLVNFGSVCRNCYNLKIAKFPSLQKVTVAEYAFSNCYSLESVSVGLANTLKRSYGIFDLNYCVKTNAQVIDITNVTDSPSYSGLQSIVYFRLKGIFGTTNLYNSKNISKESILYMINNAKSTCTINLHALAYARLSNDADVASALANKTYVSLASA